MIGSTAIQTSTLHTSHVWHNLQLSVQRRTTVGTEPVFVDLARVTFGIVVFGRALCDFEASARDDDVGGVGGAGPFLAIGAVTEGCYCWFALEE